MCGFVSKMSQGITLSNSGRQIIFVNGRPTDLPRSRVLNQTWRFEMSPNQVSFLTFDPPGHADYNVRPTSVRFSSSTSPASHTSSMSSLWEPSRFTYKVIDQVVLLPLLQNWCLLLLQEVVSTTSSVVSTEQRCCCCRKNSFEQRDEGRCCCC